MTDTPDERSYRDELAHCQEQRELVGLELGRKIAEIERLQEAVARAAVPAICRVCGNELPPHLTNIGVHMDWRACGVAKKSQPKPQERAEVEEWKEKARARQEVLVQRDAEVGLLRAALQEILDHPAPSRVATVAREAFDV
jgi:hypothetical protein